MPVLVCLAFILLSCVPDDSGLWIDERCTKTDTGIIITAVTKLNVAMGEEVVDLRFPKRHAPRNPVNDDDLDMVVCYYAEGSPRKGFADSTWNDIRLFLYETDGMRDRNRMVLSAVMHELGHYIGLKRHLPGYDDVMRAKIHGVTEYSQNDIEAFRNLME